MGVAELVSVDMHKVSVIVPVYKAERFLNRCVDSILNQRYNNLQIILVDDGSPDKSGEICDEYAASDSRVVVIHQPNQGVSAARNAGLSAAEGDLISFVDSDDWIEPEMIAEMVNKLIAYDLEIVQCGLRWVGGKIGNPTSSGSFRIMTQFEAIESMIGGICSVANKLYKRDVIINERFTVGKRFAEDLLLNTKIMLKVNCVGLLDKPYYNYYQNDESVSHENFSYDNITIVEIKLEITEMLKKADKSLSALAYGLFMMSYFENLIKAYQMPESAERKKCISRMTEIAVNTGIPIADLADPDALLTTMTEMILSYYLITEKPKRVLVISPYDLMFGCLIRNLLGHANNTPVLVDKVELDDESILVEDVYDNILEVDCLLQPGRLKRYDCIVITGVFETLGRESSLQLLKNILPYTHQSVFCVTTLLTERESSGGSVERVREYHPVAFSEFDFSYRSFPVGKGGLQCYIFYPKSKDTKATEKITQKPQLNYSHKLKIAYILPHKHLTGGLKCLLEQMRQLQKRGHSVYAIYRNQPAEKGNSVALPEWCNLDPAYDISGQVVLEPEDKFAEKLQSFDIIMLGFASGLTDFAQPIHTPVFYWEQGYEGLYGDYGQLLGSKNKHIQYNRLLYSIPVNYLAVSELVSEIMNVKYGVDAGVLYNGIDLEFYRPDSKKTFSGTILLVGNPALPFKGFAFALKLLHRVWSMGYRFKVNWACQVKPELPTLPFEINYYVMQPQEVLAKLYREADIFLSASLYESFPMPPLEAMASGTPVIAADCGGINTYACPGENMLLFEQGDMDMAATELICLLENEEVRKLLAENGRKTAELFCFERIAADLEDYFYSALDEKANSRAFQKKG